MEFNCIIVDDEPAAQRVIESYLSNISNVKIINKCTNAFEAISIIEKQKVDLIFLDINMPGISGIDFLKSLRNPPQVIITTAYRDYAVEGFELEVVDYLKKPFSFDRFFKAIQRVEEKLKLLSSDKGSNLQDHIFIKTDKKHQKIDYKDLLFIESMGDYCKFITTANVYLSYVTLKKLITLLPDEFLRVHKSFIVHFKKVDSVEGNILKLGEHSIPIGYSYKKHISYRLLN